MYVSLDGGVNWQFASGSGDKIIGDDVNGYGHDPATLPIVHRTTVNEALFLNDNEMWCGYLPGIYQSKDNGLTWSAKTRGLPNYKDADGGTIFPPFYKMVIDSRVTNFDTNTDFFACCQAGLFYWQKSKFIDLSGGLPKTSSDWAHLSVYDFINNVDTAYIATELGIYKGIIKLDDSKVSWVPLGGGTARIDSSAYNSTDAVLELYLSGVEQNTYVNIVDTAQQLFWSAKVKKEGNVFVASINESNLYFNFSPTSVDYSDYEPANVVVYLPSNVNVSDLKIDGKDVYYLSGTGLYKVNSPDTAQLVYDFGDAVYDLKIQEAKIHVGAKNGLYTALLSDLSSWAKETGVISAVMSATDTVNYDVRSIEFSSDGDLLLGCQLGGLIKKKASGEWVNLNVGLGHRNLNPTKVANVAAAFDSLEIHTEIANWFGSYPNIDNDTKQYCLLVDILDEYFLAAGDGSTFIDAFFDTTDQVDKTENAHSNKLDLIYIDSDPLDLNSNALFNAIANVLTREIILTQEVGEPEWVYRGLAELGEYLVGQIDTSITYNIASNNNLLTIGDLAPTVKDYEYNFVFFNYLHSQYLNTPEKMKAFIARPETGIEGIETQLKDLSGPTFKELYNDFAKAVHFDLLDLPEIDSRHTFPDLKVTHGSRILDWGFGSADSPYLTPQMAWSTIYYVTTGWEGNYYWCPKFDGVVTFNGEDDASYEFTTIKQKSDNYKMQVVNLDERKFGSNDDFEDFGRVDVNDQSRPYQKLYFIVNVHDTPDPAGTSHVIHDKIIPPNEFSIGFNQNVGAPDYLNIFCYTDNRIYDDAGKADQYDTDRDAISDLEGPIGWLILDNDTTEITPSHFYMDNEHNDYVYYKIVDLATITSEAMNVKIELFGENIASSRVSAVSTGNLVKISHDSGATLSIANQSAQVEIQKNTVNKTQRVSTFLTKGDLAKRLRFESEMITPISDILFLGPVDLKLQKPINIQMKLNKYDNQDSELRPVVYRQTKDGLVAIAEVEPTSSGEVCFETDQLGTYQIYLSKETATNNITPIPKVFALQQNYPNPFNISTTIRYQVPKTCDVKIVIYNLLGAPVRTLIHETKSVGFYQVEWNGLSDQNRILPSGVYIYKLITDDYSTTKKMMYLK